MPIRPDLLASMAEDGYGGDTATTVKRGDEIFAGTDYPQDWSGFVGQAGAKEQLQVQVGSALARGARIEHTLLASGLHGVGKSTLATLLAAKAGVGILQTTGPLDVRDAREMMSEMQDRDILFIDEAHLLVQGNRTRADWLLPFMTEGKLYTDRGAEPMPNIAIVAATTDAGKLPQTLISRFMVQPALVPYSEEEGAEIARSLALRMKVDVPEVTEDGERPFAAIAQAADNNPRVMRQILTGIRDLRYVYAETHPNLPKAMEWAGVSPDGLTATAREILVQLLIAPDNTLGLDSLRMRLNEPGPIRHHEQQLAQRGYVDTTGRGRKLTDNGMRRARLEAQLLTARLQ